MPRQALNKMTRKLLNRDVEIRCATTADLSGMTGLLCELFSIETDFTPDVRLQRQGLANLMKDQNANLLVAVVKSEIVGMCTLQQLVSTAEGGIVGIVEDLVITESYRGSGIGGMLLDRIEEIAQRKHMRRLQLLTDIENEDALHFYDKHGWEKLHLIAMRKKFS